MSPYFKTLTFLSFALIAPGCAPGFKSESTSLSEYTEIQRTALTQITHTKTHLELADEDQMADSAEGQSATLKELDQSLFLQDQDVQAAIDEMKKNVESENVGADNDHAERMKKHLLELIAKLENEIANTDDEKLKTLHERVLADLKRLAEQGVPVPGNAPRPPLELLEPGARPSLDPELEERIRKEIEERRQQIEKDLNS